MGGHVTTGVVIQARTGSSRYPGKMLHRFGAKTALDVVLNRCNKVRADQYIVATSEDPTDDELAEIALRNGWSVVRGSTNDVLARFAQTVRTHGLDVVVRITGDCILIDPRIVNLGLDAFMTAGADTLAPKNVIDGFDFEIIRAKVLLEAAQKAKLPSEREHVGPYIRKSSRYKNVSWTYADGDLSDIHLSLDYREDAELIGSILKRFDGADFSYEDVAESLLNDEELLTKARHVTPNEGYQLSLLSDKEYVKGLKGKPLNLTNNLDLFKKLGDLIPNRSQTFSKSYLQFSAGAVPLFVKAGNGCYLTDVDDNVFIDYAMGLGACILGYSFAPVNEAIARQLSSGTTYTLPHVLEAEVAELLTDLIPCAEMVRFGKHGSDVTSAAVRLARAYAGRDYIACCGYHGWQDWYIATTTMCGGIPESVRALTLPFKYNDPASLERLFDEHSGKIACVIMEPVSSEPPRAGFLEYVKELTHKNGALLVFDEVITGFRLHLGGAQKFYGVVPDLACLGKAMANGMPVSAIVGKREIMKLFSEVFFSFTFGGETLSLAAALATMKYLRANPALDLIWKQGGALKQGVEALIREKELEETVAIDGYPVRMVLAFKGDEARSLALKTLFQQECAKRGLLFTGNLNMSLPHTDTIIERTLQVYSDGFDIIKHSVAYDMIDEMIEGQLLRPVFRKV
jgi:glutamate-1-semialdehyde 2,1-aminomutase/spore coat polysaccharide biosynthesis protein SpsF